MDRREFLKLVGVGGLAGLSGSMVAQVLAQDNLGASALALADRDPVMHIINRLTFGVTPELYDYVATMGVENFIEEQLAPETIDDSVTDTLLHDFPLINENAADLQQQYQDQRRQVVLQLQGATLMRAVSSRRQLHEKLVQFWGDHFYIYLAGAQIIFLKIDDDRNAIRPNTLTTFRQLLGASAHSPAMLVYLDNHQSRAEHPNENYGRELLELHTLSVKGGYSEADVQAVARAFTGWSIAPFKDSDQPGTFLFRPRIHDDQAKTILGQTFAAGRGIEDGEEVLDLLAAHPSTAHFIATKLVRRFVADQPPQALVDRVANVYTQTGGDIKAMLREIFHADEFWQAPLRFKRPFEYTVSLFRALDYQFGGMKKVVPQVIRALETMGHVPFAWPAPNGYPDVAAYWMNNLLPRWNMASHVVQSSPMGAPGIETLTTWLHAQNATTQDAIVSALGQHLYGRALSETEFDLVRDFMTVVKGSEQDKWLAGLALLMAAPAFQYF